MTGDEIDEFIARFTLGARMASETGFKGLKLYSPTGGATRDALFLECSGKVRSALPDLRLILTGGFRNKTAARCQYPDLPERLLLQKQIMFETEPAPSLGCIATKIRFVEAGAESKYWARKMRNV
ncbi:hypothetical protein PLICBS_000080 [Purpureocillium lilacinum]|uniref:uncharacterized protein n=1 Tax=Purpureocillium lilacinum TaxID=33203 RepID=UPI00208581BF|nr:hypothetical protein PLICBS_000080 [Purpureocillium lilacinum]